MVSFISKETKSIVLKKLEKVQSRGYGRITFYKIFKKLNVANNKNQLKFKQELLSELTKKGWRVVSVYSEVFGTFEAIDVYSCWANITISSNIQYE